MAIANTTKIDAEQLKHKILEPSINGSIENFEISNFKFPLDDIKDIKFTNTNWTKINAKNSTFKNIDFENCNLSDINFRNITFTNVSFKNCILKNVVMNNSKFRNVIFTNSQLISTDPNIDNSYLELDIDTLTFNQSRLENIGFYKSKGIFIFNKSILNDVSGQSLKEGSSLYFNNIDAFDIDFSRSNLKNFEIKHSTIKQSKTNNCSIGNLILENNTLDYPIAQGSRYTMVKSSNTGSVVISGTPTESVKITNCPKDTRILMVGGDKFNSIEISNCSPDEMIFFESKGKYISIENADVYTMDFSASEIEHLKLNNINIKTQLYYDSSQIKKLEAKNISFGDNIEHTREGSNIEIKEDRQQIEAH